MESLRRWGESLRRWGIAVVLALLTMVALRVLIELINWIN